MEGRCLFLELVPATKKARESKKDEETVFIETTAAMRAELIKKAEATCLPNSFCPFKTECTRTTGRCMVKNGEATAVFL